jgi:transglutaminase-like putative cysteine protease
VGKLEVEVDLVADMTVINPFDFFLEPYANEFPFVYESHQAFELKPFLDRIRIGKGVKQFLDSIDRQKRSAIDFLVDLNRRVRETVEYVIRMESGVQAPDKTLALGKGSCRDSAWLLVAVLRELGLAARFASGYLIQLVNDVPSLDGPSGPPADFTDLHAWAEVYLPGAGWVGLDATSGLLAGEGHIPLACAPLPTSAAPIKGSVESSQSEFSHRMTVTRIREDPRVTKPYEEPEWKELMDLARRIKAITGECSREPLTETCRILCACLEENRLLIP